MSNKDITQGYQPIPKEDYMWNLPAGNEDCELCNGSGDLQCCAGEHYYTDTCYCVLIKYWKKIGNMFMVDGYEKLLANVIKYKTI